MAKYVRRTPIREAVGSTYKAAMGDYVSQLSKLGYEAIMYAYQNREFKHQTRNLHDSYGSAVYVKGVLQRDSIRYVGGELSSTEFEGRTGREYLNDYFDNPDVDVSSDVSLLCVAAMPYAEFLEDGSYNLAERYKAAHGTWVHTKSTGRRPRGRSIQVISAATDYIHDNYDRVKSELFETKRVRVIGGNSSF